MASSEISSAIPRWVPARMVNQFVYCKRLFYLEWVESQFATSDDVEEGLYVHRVVDSAAQGLPSEVSDWNGRRHTSVSLQSPTYKVSAKLDVVESGRDGAAIPVDFKKGYSQPDGTAWPGDRVQVLLQVLLLREAGYDVPHGEIWYDGSRRRVHVPADEPALHEVERILTELWKVTAESDAPPRLVNSRKCAGCSLVGICLPDEVSTLQKPAAERRQIRRLIAADSPARPVYITKQGSSVGVRADRLTVFADDEKMSSFRIIDVSQLCIFGNVNVSAQATRALMDRGIPILWFSFGGWFSGMTTGLPARNTEYRKRQYTLEPGESIRIASAMIAGKIHNSRTLLRRNSREDVSQALTQLQELRNRARTASNAGSLLGFEGSAARSYFGQFTKMLSSSASEVARGFDQNGRSRRPPPDPLNAVLSFTYALLVKDATVTVMAVGLDPYMGIFHQPRFGRPALALDLVEEFRPLIGDNVALQTLNNGELRSSDFELHAGGCALTRAGRKAILAAYERRMAQEVRHPLFGYRVSYRRALEVQARLLCAVLTGELSNYTPFVTR